MGLTDGASHIAFNTSCSNDFPDRDAIMKTKLNEMNNFWERIKLPNLGTHEGLAINIHESSQSISRGHAKITIFRKFPHQRVLLFPKSCMGVALIFSIIVQGKSKEILSQAHCPS